jgi:hypothetical protein
MVHSFKDEEGHMFEVYKCTESTPGFRYSQDALYYPVASTDVTIRKKI